MRCRDESFAFGSNHFFWEYEDDAKKVIGLYKFKGQRKIGRFLALVVYRYLKGLGAGDLLLVPAPCSPARLKKYGFNHIEYICRYLKRRYGIPFVDVLHRHRGQQLKKLNREERRKELAGKIFMGSRDIRKLRIYGQNRQILLLDDIFTTGTTASACAGVLRENGAESVDIITFAID